MLPLLALLVLLPPATPATTTYYVCPQSYFFDLQHC